MTDNHFPGIPSLPPRPNFGGAASPTPKPSFPNIPTPTPQPQPRPEPQPAPAPQPGYRQPSVQTPTPEANTFFNAPTPAPETNTTKLSKLRRGKKASEKPTKQPKAYSGKRRNVLITRIVLASILGILVFNGVINLVPKTSVITSSDRDSIISQVRQNLNISTFPRTTGEGFALAFTTTYLNYNPTAASQRTATLETFANKEILDTISLRQATEEEIAKYGLKVGEPGSLSQTITQGPYVVDSLMFKGGTAALVTTMSQINNGGWVYMQIPLYFDEKTQKMSISGSPTFSPPVQVATVPEAERGREDIGDTDQEVVSKIAGDISSYLEAWVKSDSVSIERYLIKDSGKVTATLDAQEGLKNVVTYVGNSDLKVETKQRPETDDAESLADFRTRIAEVNLTTLDPSSGIVYTQKYRLLLKYVNEDWFVQDIKNVAYTIDRDSM